MYVSIHLGEKEKHPRSVERMATEKKKRKPREKVVGGADVTMQAGSFPLQERPHQK